MKKKDLFSLYNNWIRFPSIINEKLVYALAKNIRKIKLELEVIREVNKPLDNFSKFEDERIKLCKEHANKDKNGKEIVTNNSYDIKNKEKFEKDLEKLQEKHKEAIEEREKQIEGYKKLLEEDVDLDFHKVKKEEVVKSLTPAQVEIVLDIIE